MPAANLVEKAKLPKGFILDTEMDFLEMQMQNRSTPQGGKVTIYDSKQVSEAVFKEVTQQISSLLDNMSRALDPEDGSR